jgi:rhomboid family protein
MLPIRSLRPRHHAPIVTLTIIILNFFAFFYELMLGPALPAFIQAFGVRPAFFLLNLTVPDIGVWLPLLSSMFLHAGWLHLGGNMLFLWVFGGNVEDRFGHVRFLALYLLAGFVATFTQVVMSSHSLAPIIGASGAIAGVLGAYLFLFPRARITTLVFILLFPLLVDLPAIVLLIVWFASQFVAGVASLETGDAFYGGVAVWGHIGGFVTGAILGLLLKPAIIRTNLS